MKYTWWCIHSLCCSSTVCELHSASPIYEPSFRLLQRLSSEVPPWISWIIRARQKERVKGQEMLSLGRTKRGGSFLSTCQALRIMAEMLVCWRQQPHSAEGSFMWHSRMWTSCSKTANGVRQRKEKQEKRGHRKAQNKKTTGSVQETEAGC